MPSGCHSATGMWVDDFWSKDGWYIQPENTSIVVSRWVLLIKTKINVKFYEFIYY